jgi:hypothetical protein
VDVRLGVSVSVSFVWRCLNSLAMVPVSTLPSSNRTCAFNASGSRTSAHAFAHGRLRVSLGNRTSLRVS